MKNVIIFDVDGTLANGEHRVHHVRNKPKNWAAYNEGMANDTVHEHTRKIYEALLEIGKYDIYIVSGREDKFREVTEKWLSDNGMGAYVELYMRPAGDYRGDDIIKEEILLTKFNKDDIVCVFDDRPRVVRMWRKNNIPVFNCGDGTEF